MALIGLGSQSLFFQGKGFTNILSNASSMPDFSACTPLAAHRTYYCPAQPGPLSAPTRPALGTNPIAFGFPSGSQLTPRWRKRDSNHGSLYSIAFSARAYIEGGMVSP